MRTFLLFLTLILAQSGTAPQLPAQQACPPACPQPSTEEVVGVSNILVPYSSGVTAYVATELGASVSAFYDAEVDAHLYRTVNGSRSELDSGTRQGFPTAGGYLFGAAGAGTLDVESDHFLIPFVYEEGEGQWHDPYGYASSTAFYAQSPLYVPAPLQVPSTYTLTYADSLYIGTSWSSVDADPPHISSVSPNSITLGSSGTFEISGTNFSAGGVLPQVAIVSGAGLTLNQSTLAVSSDTNISITYTVDTGGSSGGDHYIAVTSNAGTSNSYNVQVGDPTPVLNSANQSPNPWTPGTTGTLTVSGTGFGSNPQVTITGVDFTLQYTCPGAPSTSCDQGFTVGVSIPNGVATQTANVTVQSRGYGLGNGFLSGGSSQSNSGQRTVEVQAVSLTVPRILFNGADITNLDVSVYIGQRIALSALISLPGGATPTAQTWSGPGGGALPGDVVGGFQVTAQTGGPTPVGSCQGGPPCETYSGPSLTYYWINQGNTRRVEFRYTYAGQTSPPATTTFNVVGPVSTGTGGTFFKGTPGQIDVWSSLVAFGGIPNLYDGLEYGNGYNQSGMQFDVTANSPTGAFQWVQLIGPRNVKVLSQPSHADVTKSAGLDNWYPYATGSAGALRAADSPGVQLTPNIVNATYLGEVADSFSATMYLMWDPSLDTTGVSQPGCSASNSLGANGYALKQSSCRGSIPVALGYMTWGYRGCAINTQINQPNQTVWALNCGVAVPLNPVVQATDIYPSWSSVTMNGTLPPG